MDSYSYLFRRLLSAFSLFSVKMQTKQDQTVAIIDCNLSRKHKLILYKTQNGKLNYVDCMSFSLVFARSYLY